MTNIEITQIWLRTLTFLIGAFVAGILWAWPVSKLMSYFRKVYSKIPGVTQDDGAVYSPYVDPNVHRIVIWLGILERIFYFTSWLYGRPETIFVILAIKSTPALRGWAEPKPIEGRSKFNVWLIGNLLSIGAAIITGEVAKFFLGVWGLN